MSKGRPLKPLEVSRGARQELESLARSRSLPAGLVRRAEIVLLCANGLDNKTVAERVRVNRRTVGKWRERFRTQGLMGPYDERRPGRPRSIEDDELMTLLQRTLETKPPGGGTHWTYLPFHGRRHRGVEVHGPAPLDRVQHPASPAEALQALHRSVLRREGPRHRRPLPRRTTMRWCCASTRRARPRRWSGLSPSCPSGSDTSKVSRTATSVTAPPPSSPPWTWPPAGSSPSASRCHQEFLGFLRHIDANVPPDLDVHLVVDNYSTHKPRSSAGSPPGPSCGPPPQTPSFTRSRDYAWLFLGHDTTCGSRPTGPVRRTSNNPWDAPDSEG